MAARYWVGGTGNWDAATTTNWSASSGGAGGASVPGAADSANFNASSGGGTVTVTATQSVASISAGAFTGTLDTNGQTITCSIFDISGTGTRTITLGASTINLNNQWVATTTTNLTFNANTSTINTVGDFRGGGLTYYTVSDLSNGITFTGANTFTNLTLVCGTTKTMFLALPANQTITGTLTINGNSAINRYFVRSDTAGTARTLTAATVTMTNVDLQDITGAGAGSWNLSAITGGSGDCGGNSGITFSTPVTTNCSAGTLWSTATWSTRVPLPQDTATFSGSSRTIAQDMPRIGSVDFTGSSSLTLNLTTACSIFGSINLTNLSVLTGSSQLTFSGRGSVTINSAGLTWGTPMNINSISGILSLASDLTISPSTRSIEITSGTLDTSASNYIISVGVIFVYTSGTLNLRAGVHLLNGVSSDVFYGQGTVSGTGTLKCVGSLTGNIIFTGFGKVYPNLWNATTGAFSLNITGANTFTDIKMDPTTTIKFTAATTTTVTTFTSLGTAGNLCTIGSITAANHTLTKAGGGTITAGYMSISRSIATPTLTWLATNSTDGGNNSGWYFGSFPVANPNFFLFFS